MFPTQMKQNEWSGEVEVEHEEQYWKITAPQSDSNNGLTSHHISHEEWQ